MFELQNWIVWNRIVFDDCGVLGTFRSLWELLLGLFSTNITQILQVRKQI